MIDPIVPRATSTRATRPAHGPLVCCIYKYTNSAADLLQAYAEKNVALYQIQLNHEVVNSVLFKFKDRFLQYMKAARENDETIPKTFEEPHVHCRRGRVKSALRSLIACVVSRSLRTKRGFM